MTERIVSKPPLRPGAVPADSPRGRHVGPPPRRPGSVDADAPVAAQVPDTQPQPAAAVPPKATVAICQLCHSRTNFVSQRPAFGKSGVALAGILQTVMVIVSVIGVMGLLFLLSRGGMGVAIALGGGFALGLEVLICLVSINLLRMPQGSYLCTRCLDENVK